LFPPSLFLFPGAGDQIQVLAHSRQVHQYCYFISKDKMECLDKEKVWNLPHKPSFLTYIQWNAALSLPFVENYFTILLSYNRCLTKVK
jgi:hypothetical protein